MVEFLLIFFAASPYLVALRVAAIFWVIAILTEIAKCKELDTAHENQWWARNKESVLIFGGFLAIATVFLSIM